MEQIDLVKQVIEKNAADIPEIKYYDDQIIVLEQRLEQVNQNIEELPEPKYYEEDIQSIKIAIPRKHRIKFLHSPSGSMR